MTLSEELHYRGFVHQTTFKDLTMLDNQKVTFYQGFDASADSQTIGNLAAMMFAKVFIRHGHRAIQLAGGATSLIGDPGGKDSERPMQTAETIAANVEAASNQLQIILGADNFTLVNNLDWTKDLPVLNFLRDIGKHFSMTPLVQRDYIAKRIGENGAGISYTEFSYTLLQGMDYLHLFDKEDCTLQLGGSDQWGNCLSGVELIRRARGAEVHVITLPLVMNQLTGKKFGKSEAGAVWLDSTKTSVYAFYQFWLNIDDEGVEYYLKIYTELPKDEIDRILDQFQTNRAARNAQKTLAYHVTKLVHGQAAADQISAITATLFESNDLAQLTLLDMEVLAAELPVVEAANLDMISAVVAGSLAESKAEARRLIEQSGIYLNSQKVTLTSMLKDFEVLAGSPYVLLRRGKNKFALVRQ